MSPIALQPTTASGPVSGSTASTILVGIGGMGKVYRATAEDGTPVALKLVKDDLARDVNFRSRFEREARIAQTVRNPHVVSLRDTGEHDGQPYLATHFIEGMSLEQRLERDGRLDVATVVRICIQVADGLQALWAAGMVHRDIKPGNILIGDDGRAYITDFGLAKDHQATVALTRPGQALGSMDYMSPEQIRGETVTGATDVYSLGCVMFECVDGRPPFADHEGMRALWAHLQEEPREPCPDRADVLAGLPRDDQGRTPQGARRAPGHQRRVRALARTGGRRPDRGRHELRRRPLLAATLALLLAGCGSGSSGGSTSHASTQAGAGGSAAPPSSGTVSVVMKTLAFDPAGIKGRVGQTVKWTNQDNLPHNVIYVNGPKFASSPPRIKNGESYSIKLTAGRHDPLLLLDPPLDEGDDRGLG